MADEQQELPPREKLRLARLDRVNKEQNRKLVRVLPRDDEVRAVLKHPVNGVGFLPSGSIEWPDDSFTRKRVEEGDVTLTTPDAPSAPTAPTPASTGAAAAKSK